MLIFVWYSKKWDQLFLSDQWLTRIEILGRTDRSEVGNKRIPKGTMYFTKHGKVPKTYEFIGRLGDI